MTLENEKRFLILLSAAVCGTNASKANVLDTIEANRWIELSDKDKTVKQNRNELVWRNNLAFVRKHLVQNGMLIGNVRNNWSITDAGIAELGRLQHEVVAENSFSKISKELASKVKAGEFHF